MAYVRFSGEIASQPVVITHGRFVYVLVLIKIQDVYKKFSYAEPFRSDIHAGVMGDIVLSSVGDSVKMDVEVNKAGRPKGVIINFKNITRNLGYVYENKQ